MSILSLCSHQYHYKLFGLPIIVARIKIEVTTRPTTRDASTAWVEAVEEDKCPDDRMVEMLSENKYVE